MVKYKIDNIKCKIDDDGEWVKAEDVNEIILQKDIEINFLKNELMKLREPDPATIEAHSIIKKAAELIKNNNF
jgi:hypothetical protein